ncbi:MAG: DUF3445 domain-containing protein [Rubrivivax sp.]|nr:DUF3445 domain-containing protein [Rubrivivax sp.]
MPFDFDAAVQAPFRMQPGLRRIGAGVAHLTPLAPGSRHQREKLAVLSAFAPQALLVRAGFDPAPATAALAAHAAAEHPQAWAWDGRRATALHLGTAVDGDGNVVQTAPGQFGLGDEVARCLRGLPPGWRLAALLSLAFAEDFAIVDARDGTIPWLAVTLPSHWAPETKVGRHFAEVHAPVADSTMLLKASAGLVQLISGGGESSDGAPPRWERFVWTVTDHPRLHAHPERVAHPRWQDTPVERAWFRSERQTFIALPALAQAIFTIEVAVTPLAEVAADAQHAARLRAAIASMSDAVLAYRGLAEVREPLLGWLEGQAAVPSSAPSAESAASTVSPASASSATPPAQART